MTPVRRYASGPLLKKGLGSVLAPSRTFDADLRKVRIDISPMDLRMETESFLRGAWPGVRTSSCAMGLVDLSPSLLNGYSKFSPHNVHLSVVYIQRLYNTSTP